MNRTPRILLQLAFALSLLGVGFLVGFKLPKDKFDLKLFSAAMDKIEEVANHVNREYFENVDNEKLAEDAIKGMLEGLDPHSFYIPAKEMKAVDESMKGSFEGIGVEFNIVEDTLYVVSPISGGPSAKLGILAGDRIVKVDGEVIAGIGITNNEVFKRLRGPKGTHVKVSIKRQGIANLLEFDIERDKIPMYSVDYSYMIDNENGYIKVSRFAEKTFSEFQEHLAKLKKQGLKNLVLDLRGNPGGYMYQAEQMADAFLPNGKKIVYTQGRTPESKSEYTSTSFVNDFENGGLVVLIDYGSASASEIVSGAVQDWDRGLIVGQRSFGKGLVQTQKVLSDGSAIRFVISRYFTPSGRCVQKDFNKSSKAYNNEVWERFENGEFFDESKIKLPDSLKFKTAAGRVVYGGGGILPDVFIPRDTTGTSEYLSKLLNQSLFNKFALKYVDNHPEFAKQFENGLVFSRKFQVSEAMLKDFIAFAAEKSVPFVESDYQKSKKYVQLNLKAFIGRRLYDDDGFYPVLLSVDDTFKEALELMPQAIDLNKTGKFSKQKQKGK